MANTGQAGGVGDGRRLRGGAINAEPETPTPACVPEWHERLRDGRNIRQGQKPNEELPREVPNFAEERSLGPELRSQLPRHRRSMPREGLGTITEVTSSRGSPPTQERVDTPPPEDADEPVACSIPRPPSWENPAPGADSSAPPVIKLGTAGKIPYRAVQDYQADSKGFLNVREGDELKLACPEVKGEDDNYYFYGQKVQDSSQGWLPMHCLGRSCRDLEDECWEETDWEQFTDPDSKEMWFWRKSTEEYFFAEHVREWRKAFDHSSEGGVWWCHQMKKRCFKQPIVPELEEDQDRENPQEA